jgi:hypothetical protein
VLSSGDACGEWQKGSKLAARVEARGSWREYEARSSWTRPAVCGGRGFTALASLGVPWRVAGAVNGQVGLLTGSTMTRTSTCRLPLQRTGAGQVRTGGIFFSESVGKGHN